MFSLHSRRREVVANNSITLYAKLESLCWEGHSLLVFLFVAVEKFFFPELLPKKEEKFCYEKPVAVAVVTMKINNCKLCEVYDDQKLSGDKAQPFCRHTSAAAAFISPSHIRDFLAFHLLRGNYQLAFVILDFLSLSCRSFRLLSRLIDV